MGGRKPMPIAEAWALLAALTEVQVAGVVDNSPRLATMHTVVHDGAVWLHGAPGIALAELEGSPVVLAGAQLVARIPSHFRDPVRACPATTFYRSVQAMGTLEAVADLDARAAAFQALMLMQQPEGLHAPVDATDVRYTGALRALGMWRIVPDTLTAVHKLGQQLSVGEITGILRGLWQRGAPGDLQAIEAISLAHPERPPFCVLPDDLVARCAPTDADLEAAAALVAGRYWNRDQTVENLVLAHQNSAWVGIARDGRLIATARAISDVGKRSWIYDVAVDDDFHGQGIGRHLMALVLDHPAVRGTEVNLGTRDAMAFYEQLGFAVTTVDERGPYPRHWMVRAKRPSVRAA